MNRFYSVFYFLKIYKRSTNRTLEEILFASIRSMRSTTEISLDTRHEEDIPRLYGYVMVDFRSQSSQHVSPSTKVAAEAAAVTTSIPQFLEANC